MIAGWSWAVCDSRCQKLWCCRLKGWLVVMTWVAVGQRMCNPAFLYQKPNNTHGCCRDTIWIDLYPQMAGNHKEDLFIVNSVSVSSLLNESPWYTHLEPIENTHNLQESAIRPMSCLTLLLIHYGSRPRSYSILLARSYS